MVMDALRNGVESAIPPIRASRMGMDAVRGLMSGGDGDAQTAGDPWEQVMDLLDAGRPVPVELLAQAQAADSGLYDDLFGGLDPQAAASALDEAGGTPAPTGDTLPDEGGDVLPSLTGSAGLGAIVNDLIEQARLPEQIGADGFDENAFAREAAMGRLPDIVLAWERAAGLDGGKVKLGDGTVLSREDIEAYAHDPFAQAQLLQTFQQHQAEIENQTRSLLNQYRLDEYTMQRGQVDDANSAALQRYNAEIATVRERLARDQMSIQQATEAIDRILSGQEESRARASLVTDTQLQAAPYATSGGKTAFSPRDLGSASVASAIRRGVSPDDPSIQFPGTIRLDPAALMQQGDAALGVTGALPQIPGLSVSDADIPRAPSLGGYGHIQMPELMAPVSTPAISIPEDVLASIIGGGAGRPTNPVDAANQQRQAFR